MKKIYQMTKEISGNYDTPITLFLKLRGTSETFLLESATQSTNSGRYSFIHRNPLLRVKQENGLLNLISSNSKKSFKDTTIEGLRKIINSYSIDKSKDFFDFGLVGYFAFDLIREYEDIKYNKQDELNMPDSDVILPGEIIVYDHLYRTIKIVVNCFEEDRHLLESKIINIETQLKMPISTDEAKPNKGGVINSNFTKDQFEEAVDKAKKHIIDGDIFQLVLSQRFSTKYSGDPFEVYKKLRNVNPSPYMYFLDYGTYHICGSSPEALVKVDNNIVSTNPIAGTVKRGKDEEEDLANAKELLSDEKEKAEHLMLLDLGRNDIGKVSNFGSVKVSKFMEVNKYSHVMHLVSDVEGTLKDDKDIFDAFISCHPAGTVSGAPKIRAIQIIDDLEDRKRGVYAGAVGYFSLGGKMDTCIAIRTLVFKDSSVHFQAGAGIVKDSIPENEFYETINKASALVTALGGQYDFNIR
jgi:anthranilate synthase component 1